MGFRMVIYDAVAGGMHALLSSRWFPLTRYVPPGLSWIYDVQRMAKSRQLPIIFDGGANVGQTASALVRYFPESRIFCFEPIAATIEKLKANHGHHANITMVQQAVADRISERVVKLHRASVLNSLVETSDFTDFTGETENIRTTTIDQFCLDNNIKSIDLLKMDIQGSEMAALSGARSMIENNKIHFIYSEVGMAPSPDMTHFPDLHTTLLHKGFVFCGLYDCFSWGPEKGPVSFANALYLNRNYHPAN